jgi:uncharacterized 2Fe-2S/4Fe-4S cluster protein (DUF4445 family)
VSRPARYSFDLEPIGRRAEIAADETLLEAAQSGGIELASLCGGIGLCDSCRVRLVTGTLSALTTEEGDYFTAAELAAGWRLACQAYPRSDIKIDIPPESLTTPQRLLLEGEADPPPVDPLVRAVDVSLAPAALDDLRADWGRVSDTLRAAGHEAVTIDLAALRALPDVLRAHEWSARLALRADTGIVAALPPGAALLGLAVDVGTTGLAAYLVDLTSGETLARVGAMNPQIAYGEDVISRIVYLNEHPQQSDVLRQRLMGTLNEMIATLCAEAGSAPESIVEVTLAGNTAMHHIAAGLPVRQLGEAPYVPVTGSALEFAAAEIGLRVAAGARVYLPPNIAGYVGADHTAVLLAADGWQMQHTAIIIDIGTNTEITLLHAGRRLSCSCASGPAFEGAHIRDGMRAAPGAIERVQLVEGRIQLQIIGGGAPVGVCGSGILDVVALMVDHGLVDRRGAFNPDHPLIHNENGSRAFILAPAATTAHGRDVTITRRDVSEIQLAKAAIRAGIDILLDEAGIAAEMVEDFVIAGAFGSYINLDSALRIGMFPALPPERFRQIGNAAGTGARRLLTSRVLRARAAELVQQIEYIELTTHAGFQTIFMNRMALEDSR